MASATKTKKAAPKPRSRNQRSAAGVASRKARPPARDPLDDIEAPDRAAPQMAEVDGEALEFIAAIERFKKQHMRPFPSWSEILLILRQLGYKRG